MTAGEGLAGYVRFRSTIPDFEPQEWPLAYSIHASLGTPVGQPVHFPGPVPWYAMSFPCMKRNETISPYAVFVVASTALQSVSASIAYL